MTTQKNRTYHPIEFPDPPQPLGCEPAKIRPMFNGDPFLGEPAVGEVKAERGEKLMLEVPDHRPGQIRSLLSCVEPGRIRRVDIQGGAISAEDLGSLRTAAVDEVRLGMPRTGLEPLEQVELEFTDGPNLSRLSGPQRLHLLNIPMTTENLASIGTTSVDVLFLSGITVDPSLLARFKFLRSMYVTGWEGDVNLSFIESMSDLSGLGFRFSELGVDQLARLKHQPELSILDLAYNSRLGPDLSHLASYPGLSFLDISTTNADDSTLASLSKVRFLKTLVAQCAGITDDGVAPLRERTGLTSLNLAGNRITDAGLDSLAGHLPNLRTLDLRDTDITIDAVVDIVPRFPEVRVLGVSGDLLNADVGEHLSEHTSIESFYLCPPLDGDGWIEAVDIIGAAKWNGKPV